MFLKTVFINMSIRIMNITGCITTVSIDPLVDGNATYSDNQWHHVEATRVGIQGTLTIDGNITGVYSS